MKAIWFFLGGCMLIGACCPLTSTYPLGGPDAVSYDDRLTGSWEVVPASDERLFFHMGRGEDQRLRIVGVEHRADGRINHTDFLITAVRIADRTFINLDLNQLEKEVSLDNSGFIILQYDLPTPDTLVLRHMNIQAVAAAVGSKTLGGEITYSPIPTVPVSGEAVREVECVRITDTSANLVQFVSHADAKNLFTHEVKLKRIK